MDVSSAERNWNTRVLCQFWFRIHEIDVCLNLPALFDRSCLELSSIWFLKIIVLKRWYFRSLKGQIVNSYHLYWVFMAVINMVFTDTFFVTSALDINANLVNPVSDYKYCDEPGPFQQFNLLIFSVRTCMCHITVILHWLDIIKWFTTSYRLKIDGRHLLLCFSSHAWWEVKNRIQS